MPGASPLVDDLDTVKRLEDAGAAAIVMRSLFEEQITLDQLGTIHSMEVHEDSFAEALSYFPKPDEYQLGPDQYLEQLARIKAAVSCPVIGSLNGVTPAGWLDYARSIEQAGADALELNVYHIATSPEESGRDAEDRLVEIVEMVRKQVTIPLAVKLSPYYSAMAHLACALDARGVNGLVLFNRFYQPDIDIESLEAKPVLHLSDNSELLLRLRWLAVLSGRLRASLAVTGGVHSAIDAIKAVMAGAHAVQMVSALLEHGPEHLARIRTEVAQWLEEHEYRSLSQMQGSMSLERSPNPEAFERANYMRVLHSWRA
jgi:dihydroorotate dehydrogenase (fumarate)